MSAESYVTLDPRVAHQGIGGFGYCVNCGSTRSGLCPAKRSEHPVIWAREARRLEPHPLPIHRTEAGYPNCSTCDGGGCYDCTDPA